ncbi:tripartite tricarboxylate transporter permease [Chelativorans salis]|uniref:Tripartite tricarboxylate transporter permease n=1 Tax=Chelativorans salis TaxID=2978478 RepID=A0ABT2LUS3_9HYPH|nr:tripartite tricarboxylate transporter permease [Chelativorans sp. EGI FJ00035]MCT7378136.1 tripartite tricarboxylate transporter permease [Chelativorans sp. EGI FJ00035]
MAELLQGFSVALSAENLAYCFIGVFLGMVVGVLPGIGSLAAISMLLPITFYLDPTTAIIMLAGVYYGSEYGGSTASILLNLPGTPSNAVTCLDGYPMAQKGRAGVALFVTTIASFVGGSLGIILLTVATPAFISFAMMFQSKEYFVALLLGLIMAATISQGSPARGLAVLGVGILLGCIGADIQTGMARFTMGRIQLFDGISIVIVAMGLFGVSEIIWSIAAHTTPIIKDRITLQSLIPTRDDIARSAIPTLRGTAVGSIVGPLPGAGLALASFFAYALEKRFSRRPEAFGTGIVEGIAAPEAANNAAAQTAFIPTFALGIPGTTTMAIMLGAMMMHGIVPGPQFVRENFDMFWAVVASFWIGNLILLLLNIPFIGVWVRLLKIPYVLLYPAIICLVCIGVYSLSYSVFDVVLLLGFGLLGYVLRLIRFEAAPLLMGFVLGPLLEENFRRALLLAQGDLLTLFSGPINTTMLTLAGLASAWAIYARIRALRRSEPSTLPAASEDA